MTTRTLSQTSSPSLLFLILMDFIKFLLCLP
jgi:hypothetical protein